MKNGKLFFAALGFCLGLALAAAGGTAFAYQEFVTYRQYEKDIREIKELLKSIDGRLPFKRAERSPLPPSPPALPRRIPAA